MRSMWRAIAIGFVCAGGAWAALAVHRPSLAQVADYKPANMSNFGVTFLSLNVPAGQQVTLPNGSLGITSQQAVTDAEQHAEAVDASHNVLPGVQVSAGYGMLSDSHIEQMTPAGEVPIFQRTPSWVVTFTGVGVNIMSSGPRNSPEYVHHEESVVIDASTGRFLFSFS